MNFNFFVTILGFHHWGHSIRTDDSPLEARLLHLCDEDGVYLGADAVSKIRNEVPKKVLVCFTIEKCVKLDRFKQS